MSKPNKILVYTDGACSGNPGPGGIGVVLKYKKFRKEISEFIGETTNNRAELKAIKKALETIREKNIPVEIYVDSTYICGMLSKNWKPKKNKELIAEIKRALLQFKDITLIKISAHQGIEENERADRLARKAILNHLASNR